MDLVLSTKKFPNVLTTLFQNLGVTGSRRAEKRFGVNLRQVFSFIFSLVGQVIFQGCRHSSSKRNTHLHCILISGQP